MVTYWLDRNNIITAVSMPGWNEFAWANGGAEVTADQVVDRNLRCFVVGITTLMWLESILELVRLKNVPIEWGYRCDSPTEKRYMTMRVSLQSHGQLCLEHQLLQTQLIAPPIGFEYAGATKSLRVERCSICNRIRPNGIWLEPDTAIKKGLIRVTCSLPVVYAVCEECMFQLHNLRYHFT